MPRFFPKGVYQGYGFKKGRVSTMKGRKHTEIDNGRTLCVDCHKTTETYGRPKTK